MPRKEFDTSTEGACEVSCPVAKAASLIDGKWTTRIIRDLLTGKKRYSELQHSLTGISPKVLADRLRFLEHQGLITKEALQKPVQRTRNKYLVCLGA